MPSKSSKCFFFENFNGGSISAIYNKTTSLKNYVTILRFFNSTYLSEKDLYNFEFVSTITIQNDKESWILIGWKTNNRWTKVLSRILVFLCVERSDKLWLLTLLIEKTQYKSIFCQWLFYNFFMVGKNIWCTKVFYILKSLQYKSVLKEQTPLSSKLTSYI